MLDALNILAEDVDLLELMPQIRLTPHPKELQRLIGLGKMILIKLEK